MQHKFDIATGVSYAASGTGFWLADNWLQVLSGIVIVLTFLAQLWFGMRKDRRELRQAQREAERHARENGTGGPNA